MKSICTESTANVDVLANCPQNGEKVTVGAAANGNVVLPTATEANGNYPMLAKNVPVLQAKFGMIVTSAEPSAMVVTGIYKVVAI